MAEQRRLSPEDIEAQVALESAENAVRSLPLPMAITYSVARAAAWTAAAFVGAWALGLFNPWWTLVVLPLAWRFSLRTELATEVEGTP